MSQTTATRTTGTALTLATIEPGMIVAYTNADGRRVLAMVDRAGAAGAVFTAGRGRFAALVTDWDSLDVRLAG